VLGIAVAKSLVDALSRRAQERRPVRLRHLLSTPLKDLVFAWSWAQAMVSSRVIWRGNAMRVLEGTRIERVGKPRV
ncbi:MAG: hypothetical protein ACYCWW_13610, partial [Deltaproteobacteria bacterium]